MAQAVTVAYAVLSDPSSRSAYDAQWRTSTPPKFRSQSSGKGRAKLGSLRQSALIGLFFLVPALLLIVWLTTEPLTISPEQLASVSPLNEDYDGHEEAILESTAAAETDVACSELGTTSVKRELFARTAQLRGIAVEELKNLASKTSLHMGSQSFTETGFEAFPCAVSLLLTLPEGFKAPQGRRVLMGEVVYAPGAKGTMGPISPSLLQHLAAVELPKNSINRLVVSAPRAGASAHEGGNTSESGAAGTPPLAKPIRPVRNERRPPALQSPSFICSSASSWAAGAVCSKAELAELDRKMAHLYGDSLEGAEPSQRALLSRSDAQFLANRDQCRSEQCVRAAYRARMDQIRSLVAAKDRTSPRP
jgi:uncharacterized protein YecT (DUF1311 family)